MVRGIRFIADYYGMSMDQIYVFGNDQGVNLKTIQ